jgi:small neutral amino acid transporter SnatA (MarC family)
MGFIIYLILAYMIGASFMSLLSITDPFSTNPLFYSRTFDYQAMEVAHTTSETCVRHLRRLENTKSEAPKKIVNEINQ